MILVGFSKFPILHWYHWPHCVLREGTQRPRQQLTDFSAKTLSSLGPGFLVREREGQTRWALNFPCDAPQISEGSGSALPACGGAWHGGTGQHNPQRGAAASREKGSRSPL